MDRKYLKIINSIITTVFVVYMIILLLFKDKFGPEIVFLFIGCMLAVDGILGLLYKAVLFGRGDPYGYEDEEIFGRAVNIILSIAGCGFIVAFCLLIYK